MRAREDKLAKEMDDRQRGELDRMKELQAEA